MFHQALTTSQKSKEMPQGFEDKDSAGLDILVSTTSTIGTSLFPSHRACSSPVPVWFTELYLFTLLPHRIPLPLVV